MVDRTGLCIFLKNRYEKKKEIHRKFWRAIIGHRLKGHDTDEAEVVNNQFLHNKKISVLVFSYFVYS